MEDMGWLVAVIIFLAVLTQTATGFGLALVSMGLRVQMLGIQVAAPLVALTAASLELILLVRHRRALNWNAVWKLSAASIVGIPLGILALRHVNERIILTVLGLVIVGYAVYALANPRMPELQPGWAWGFGFLAGLLGGAYNTAGPPAVIYGNGRRWSPSEFKSNLQSFFLLNDALVILGHAVSHHLTPIVWAHYWLALPALALGLAAGLTLERFIHPEAFRKVVLLLLIVMGAQLIGFLPQGQLIAALGGYTIRHRVYELPGQVNPKSTKAAFLQWQGQIRRRDQGGVK